MVEVDKALVQVNGVHPLDNISTEKIGDVVSKKDIKKAFDNEQLVIQAKTMMVQISFTLAQYLTEIFDNRQHKILGFDSFEAWSESPQIDIDRSSSYRYVKLYKVFIASGAFTIEELQDKGISKLEVVLQRVDPSAPNWSEIKQQILQDLVLTRKELILLTNDGRISLQRAADEARTVDARFEVMKGSESESEVVATVKGDKKINKNESQPKRSVNPQKSLGIAGWYELVPMDEKPSHGKTVAGVYLNAAKVVVSGTKIFVDIE